MRDYRLIKHRQMEHTKKLKQGKKTMLIEGKVHCMSLSQGALVTAGIVHVAPSTFHYCNTYIHTPTYLGGINVK